MFTESKQRSIIVVPGGSFRFPIVALFPRHDARERHRRLVSKIYAKFRTF